MKRLKNPSSLDLCEEFTRNELKDLQESKAWMSWWPVMERMLNRSYELEQVYTEICGAFGHSLVSNPPFRLTMEAIWCSGKAFSPDTVVRKKAVQTELIKLHEEIPALCCKLAEAIRRQKELAEQEDFGLGEYFSFVDVMTAANEDNGHYNSFLEPEMEKLAGSFDGKYWPDLEDFIEAVGRSEAMRPEPVSGSLPKAVTQGRASRFKNYVLALDESIENCFQIPSEFHLSNTSMATIANVVLDLPAEDQILSDTVRLIRHRKKACV